MMEESCRKVRRRSLRNLRRSSTNFLPVNLSLLEASVLEEKSVVADNYGSAWLGDEQTGSVCETSGCRFDIDNMCLDPSKNVSSESRKDHGCDSVRSVVDTAVTYDFPETNSFCVSTSPEQMRVSRTEDELDPERTLSISSTDENAIAGVCNSSMESLPEFDLSLYGSLGPWLDSEAGGNNNGCNDEFHTDDNELNGRSISRVLGSEIKDRHRSESISSNSLKAGNLDVGFMEEDLDQRDTLQKVSLSNIHVMPNHSVATALCEQSPSPINIVYSTENHPSNNSMICSYDPPHSAIVNSGSDETLRFSKDCKELSEVGCSMTAAGSETLNRTSAVLGMSMASAIQSLTQKFKALTSCDTDQSDGSIPVSTSNCSIATFYDPREMDLSNSNACNIVREDSNSNLSGRRRKCLSLKRDTDNKEIKDISSLERQDEYLDVVESKTAQKSKVHQSADVTNKLDSKHFKDDIDDETVAKMANELSLRFQDDVCSDELSPPKCGRRQSSDNRRRSSQLFSRVELGLLDVSSEKSSKRGKKVTTARRVKIDTVENNKGATSKCEDILQPQPTLYDQIQCVRDLHSEKKQCKRSVSDTSALQDTKGTASDSYSDIDESSLRLLKNMPTSPHSESRVDRVDKGQLKRNSKLAAKGKEIGKFVNTEEIQICVDENNGDSVGVLIDITSAANHGEEQFHIAPEMLDTTVDSFVVPSEDEDILPHEISTKLLQKNTRRSQRSYRRKSWVSPSESQTCASSLSGTVPKKGKSQGCTNADSINKKDILESAEMKENEENIEVTEALQKLYRNKNYQPPPADGRWETIKEHPTGSKDIFLRRKLPRLLTFLEGLTQPRLVKRHRKAMALSSQTKTKPVSLTDEEFQERIACLDKVLRTDSSTLINQC